MRKKSYNTLLKRFKNLFKHGKMEFECGIGWYSIILRAFEQIEQALQNETKDFRDRFFVIQVKEKFGRLRIYTTIHSAAINEPLHEAEISSSKVCEKCGAPSNLKKGRRLWSTLCDHCDTIYNAPRLNKNLE